MNPGMFALVSDMNTAFGNPKGDPANINWKRIASQCKNITAEYKEHRAAVERDDIEECRDALCDILVFSLGAHHLMGFDPVVDLRQAVALTTGTLINVSPSMFGMVQGYNRAIGVSRGNPHAPHYAAAVSITNTIPAQHEALIAAIGKEDSAAVRRVLTSINIAAMSAIHVLGYDAEADMAAVVEGVMTRFCQDEADLAKTKAQYDSMGIEYYVAGEFPRVCLKSARDQGGDEYPKDKFLKSASYRKPVFPPAPAY